VDARQHRAAYAVGMFVAAMRGQGVRREAELYPAGILMGLLRSEYAG
jgi:hypothetical protein